jgi:hypothetical protein
MRSTGMRFKKEIGDTAGWETWPRTHLKACSFTGFAGSLDDNYKKWCKMFLLLRGDENTICQAVTKMRSDAWVSPASGDLFSGGDLPAGGGG